MLNGKNQVTAQQISFGDFQLLTGEAIDGRNKMVDFFMSMWREKGGPTHKIMRQDINPVEMKRYLEHLVILDVEHADNDWALRVRLIGGYVANFYGELAGKDVREMKNTQAISRIYQACARVLETKSAVLTTSPAFAPERLHLEAIALYMPLFDAKAKVEKVLICVNITTQK
ncbi:PAS domain-containing protein [Kordiimonas aquimaris]|uniref:PAS domain-containing protein n=1 Tax=Kordiimonas aquimaris TaxID=707591 RepID=UPI0021CEDD10|nr:PAS domain-containing protein [Kordiimonas aquimaris]